MTDNRPAADPKPLLVDVRTPAEYRELHIPGSRNVPLSDLDHVLEELMRDAGDKGLTLICRTGQRAGKAQDKLAAAGMTCCEVLPGGVAAWEESGQPVNRGRKSVSLERQVRIVAGIAVLAGAVLAATISPWFLAVPMFFGAGLAFSGITDTCGMGMVLARMPWNRA